MRRRRRASERARLGFVEFAIDALFYAVATAACILLNVGINFVEAVETLAPHFSSFGIMRERVSWMIWHIALVFAAKAGGGSVALRGMDKDRSSGMKQRGLRA